MSPRRAITSVTLLLILTVLVIGSDRPFWRPVIMGTHGMVTAEHPLAAQAGLGILEAGGNVFDAALAIFYMTTVVEQHQAGIGGDAFVLAYLASEKRVVFVNGTGPAPRLATREHYLKQGGIPDAGPISSTVPGAVGGFELAWKRYGKLGRAKILESAIALAREGHPLTFWSASQHQQAHGKLSVFPSSMRSLFNNGKAFKPGEIFVQPDLARTLERISQDGPAAFYQGPIARQIAHFYEQEKGLLQLSDLAGFEAEEATAIKTVYHDYEVYQCPPNSQGIVLLIVLNILEGFDLKKLEHNAVDYLHLVTEALKLAFADRDQYVGDPRFARDIPVAGLLSKDYAARRRALIRTDRAIRGVAPPGDPRSLKPVLSPFTLSYEELRAPQAALRPTIVAQGETSSFAIADRYGNLLSSTHSVNGAFGSGMVVDGGGFVLNNRMPYFNLEEAHINVLKPGKRPLHTINLALALKNGKPFLAWNTPGGDNQPQAMLQAFLNVVEFGMNIQQAVEAPTVTTSSFAASMYPHAAANELTIPRLLADQVGTDLAARGHRLRVTPLQQPYYQQPSGAGAVKMILLDPQTGVMQGGVSPAKDDYVLGW